MEDFTVGIGSYLFNFLFSESLFAEILLTTFLPVFCSISFRVLPAIVPPCLAIVLFCSNDLGFFSLLISAVVA
jgi:hypothetical protein